jgi:hypothetical protein
VANIGAIVEVALFFKKKVKGENMGTSNFYKENASCYFVIDNNYGKDEFIYDDTKENIHYGLKDMAKKKKRTYIGRGKRLNNDNTQWGGEYYDTIIFGDKVYYVTIKPIFRVGYYTGGTLDYLMKIEGDSGFDCDNVDDMMETIKNYPTDFNLNSGLVSIHKDNIREKLESLSKNLIEEVEHVFRMYSVQYQMAYRFSNGETGYSEIEGDQE